MVVTGRIAIAALLFFCSAGCAERREPAQPPPQQTFWHDCQETVPAYPDGYQHFICTDMRGRHWDVRIKPTLEVEKHE